ncbi:microtubule associated protein-domain-containing protein, partial [Vararia minispora EC-137]
SITSLLNSLHSHLQAQTQALPTLHAQLGLPPTALADELAALQAALTRAVEDQIEGRRREVDDWVARCDEAEDECARYAAALGAGVKGLGASVLEARKEAVLPRRYEIVTEVQEKLRQLYHTKLEQLLTLTARLATLARTLPDGFFSDDLLEPLMDNYTSAYRDVTPERFARLEKELVRGKAEAAKRLQALAGVFVQIDFLHSELGIPLPEIDDPRPVASSSTLGVPPISRPPSALGQDPFLVATPTPTMRTPNMLTSLLGARSISSSTGLSFPADHDIDERACERVFARWAAAHADDDDERSDDGSDSRRLLVGLEHVEPCPALLVWAQRTRAELEELKRRREAHIQAMYDQLEILWRRLGVADADMDGFVEAHTGSTEASVKEYEAELERMLELKRESMSTFVENARAEIARLWDELMSGLDEREGFPPFFDDEHTEELLALHEDEIRRLKDERRRKAPLLGAVRRYFEICAEERELASSAADTSRLLGRGPRDPGRLLREEKMRKRVRKEKPRLEQELLATIPAWEAEAGRPFCVHGESMLQLLLEASAPPADGKENKRGSSVPPARARTPAEPPAQPHPRRGVVRPASADAQAGPPSKRARTGDVKGGGGDSIGGGAPGKLVMPVPVRSALPRLVPVPRLASQHASLGHGRVPSAQQAAGLGLRQSQSQLRSQSLSQPRTQSQTHRPQTASVARKASRARRESFRPRPSAD